MTVVSTLQRMCAWYRSQCDGEWEHRWGVTIGTLDNPGWTVDIDLEGTVLQGVPFDAYEDGDTDEDAWIRCCREGNTFKAACGPERLEAALRVFLDWASAIEGASRLDDAADDSRRSGSS